MRRLALCLLCAALPLVAAAQSVPDLVIINGKVFTADPANRFAEAVAIRENRIVAVGTTHEMLAMASPRTKVIDVKKHLVVPGFNDAHTHQGPNPAEVFVLSTTPSSSWDDLMLALGNATEETPEGPWILGVIGPKILNDPRTTVAALDKASHNRKVVLREFTGHGLIVSGTALQALHVNGDNIPGGWFERDASGRLTGKMFEYAEFDALRRLTDLSSDDDATEQLRQFANNALQAGVTTIQNMSFFPMVRYDKIVRHASPPIPLRIRMIRSPSTNPAEAEFNEGTRLPATTRERPLAVLNAWKWILDGTPIEQGAALRTNYTNTTANGRLNFTPEQLASIVKAAFESKDQTLFHVSGDRTAAALFEAMKAVAPAEKWRAKRVRIEHGDGLLPDLIPVAKDLGVVVVVNPLHFDAKPLYPKGAYMPLKSLIAAGIPVAIGSDTGAAANPFADIAAATSFGSESISREEAVELYTRGSAYAEFAENDKGTIASGKLADLAVLSEDILSPKVSDIGGTRSLLTIVDGKTAYDASVFKTERADDIKK